MAKVDVLVEIVTEQDDAFTVFEMTATASARERVAVAERIGRGLSGAGLEFTDIEPPVPMFSETVVFGYGAMRDHPRRERAAEPGMGGFQSFSEDRVNPDVSASSVVVAAQIDEERWEELANRPAVRVWPNSELTLIEVPRVDCHPFREAASIEDVRTALDVDGMRRAGGGSGGTIGVAILDEGVDGSVYPVSGGFALRGAQQPGTAFITSHGSMCAADVLVAAPDAVLFDYPFLGVPRSGGALRMFQALLDERRRTGRPHVANNSYGFVGVPARASAPSHEVWDLNHPIHRKVREVVASGVTVLFAAGNCGGPCPSRDCHASGVGAGRSIHASNSLAEVITVAAINTAGSRVGYSSQGPGMFEPRKPDVACYTHFFGNFGPGRPGGTHEIFDSGTSAATPVAAGLVAAILSAAPALSPGMIKRALIESTGRRTWTPDVGFGAVHAARAWAAAQAMLTS